MQVKTNQIDFLYIYICPYTYTRFCRLGDGWSPPTSQLFAHFPHQESIPPTTQQFSSYNPIKTEFLAVVNAPAPFLF